MARSRGARMNMPARSKGAPATAVTRSTLADRLTLYYKVYAKLAVLQVQSIPDSPSCSQSPLFGPLAASHGRLRKSGDGGPGIYFR